MTTSLDFDQFDFASSLSDVGKGLIVKPILHNYLFDAKFPAFSLHFEKQDMERKPDGWFHPSTHPLMKERVLYNYLAYPDRFPVEKKQYMSTLSVTVGKVLHEFFQMCLTDAGIRPAALQRCEVCPEEDQCTEAGVVDHEVGERGHVDGILDLSTITHVPQARQFPVWEFKSAHDNFSRLTKIEDLDLETFKTKWPDYYAQQQSYMRMSRRSLSIVTMMEIGYPWTMREFHVPFDAGYSANIDAKYRRVRQAVADRTPPYCCGLKGCISKNLCAVTR